MKGYAPCLALIEGLKVAQNIFQQFFFCQKFKVALNSTSRIFF